MCRAGYGEGRVCYRPHLAFVNLLILLVVCYPLYELLDCRRCRPIMAIRMGSEIDYFMVPWLMILGRSNKVSRVATARSVKSKLPPASGINYQAAGTTAHSTRLGRTGWTRVRDLNGIVARWGNGFAHSAASTTSRTKTLSGTLVDKPTKWGDYEVVVFFPVCFFTAYPAVLFVFLSRCW